MILPTTTENNLKPLSKVVRIHSTVVDGGLATVGSKLGYKLAVAVYYYCRGIDTQGRGVVFISLDEVASQFGVKRNSVRDSLRHGLRLGFFRSVTKMEDGYYRIYLGGLGYVLKTLGIPSLGAMVEVEVDAITPDFIKHLATEAEVIRKQLQSKHKAMKAHKVKELDSTDSVLSESFVRSTRASDGEIESVSYRNVGSKFVCVSEDFKAFGGSQESIGKNLGRHRNTISRRLNNKRRAKVGLPELERKQLLIVNTELTDLAEEILLTGNGFDELDYRFHKTHYSGGSIYEFRPNIYSENLVLISGRAQRRRISKLLNHD